MDVLVTGATGYVGAEVVKALVAEGHGVSALVRDRQRARAVEQTGARLLVGTLDDIERLFPTACDAVVHCAFTMFPGASARTNVEGSRRTIAAATRARVKRFVYTSSALVYGPSDPAALIDETSSCAPNTKFARHQREVERMLSRAAEEQAFPSVILRPSEVFGGRGGAFDQTVERLKSGQMVLAEDGRQQLSFTERADLVSVIVRCLEGSFTPGDIMNVGTPVLVESGALFDALADRLGVARPRRVPSALLFTLALLSEASFALVGKRPPFDRDIARLVSFTGGVRVIDKARRLLGFEPRHADPMAAILSQYNMEATAG